MRTVLRARVMVIIVLTPRGGGGRVRCMCLARCLCEGGGGGGGGGEALFSGRRRRGKRTPPSCRVSMSACGGKRRHDLHGTRHEWGKKETSNSSGKKIYENIKDVMV